MRVRIRGCRDHERKAVYMEGTISPGPAHIRQAEELPVLELNENDQEKITRNIFAVQRKQRGKR